MCCDLRVINRLWQDSTPNSQIYFALSTLIPIIWKGERKRRNNSEQSRKLSKRGGKGVSCYSGNRRFFPEHVNFLKSFEDFSETEQEERRQKTSIFLITGTRRICRRKFLENPQIITQRRSLSEHFTQRELIGIKSKFEISADVFSGKQSMTFVLYWSVHVNFFLHKDAPRCCVTSLFTDYLHRYVCCDIYCRCR